jgi:hypothetical protein
MKKKKKWFVIILLSAAVIYACDWAYVKIKYKDYCSIDDSPSSENYTITKVADMEAILKIFYNQDYHQMLFVVQQDTNRLFLKFDAEGQLLSSVCEVYPATTAYREIVATPGYCLDWIISGNIEPQPYAQIINKEKKMSLAGWDKMFVDLYERSDIAQFGYTINERNSIWWMDKDYEDQDRICLFHIDGQWYLLYANPGKPYFLVSNDNYCYKINEKEYPQKVPQLIDRHIYSFWTYGSSGISFQEPDKNPETLTRNNYHRSKLHFSLPDFDFGLSTTGHRTSKGTYWDAEGYFTLHHRGEKIHFKKYCEKPGLLGLLGVNANLTLFYPPAEDAENCHAAFIQGINSDGRTDSNFYVVQKKN